jgi:hypothetical protein
VHCKLQGAVATCCRVLVPKVEELVSKMGERFEGSRSSVSIEDENDDADQNECRVTHTLKIVLERYIETRRNLLDPVF